MKTKPWPILVLACLYVIGPILNTLVGAWMSQVSYSDYLRSLFSESGWLSAASSVLLFPLAGYAIFAVRSWSYPVYLGLMGLSVYLNYSTWQNFSDLFTLPVFIAALFVNLGLVSYYLLPAVRDSISRERLGWWKTKPRYEVDVPAVLVGESRQLPCTILNLSMGGAFLKTDVRFQVGFETTMSFDLFEHSLQIAVRVIHARAGDEGGVGVLFLHSEETEDRLTQVVSALRRLGTPVQQRRRISEEPQVEEGNEQARKAA